MRSPAATVSHALPTWLLVAGSLFIVGHLLALAVAVLSASSGPWPTPDGPGKAAPPQFAAALHRLIAPNYLQWMRMTDSYHFASNRPGAPGVYFEARLKDGSGQVFLTLTFPDAHANPAVRERQALLARALADDQPLPSPEGEKIPAPGRQVEKVPFWDSGEPRALKLREVPEHLLPRDRPLFRPSAWSLLLARSYARYLCRAHGAASAELIRHTREAIPPAALSGQEGTPDSWNDLVADFGDLPGE